MVPCHFSNELKPNSGDAASGIRNSVAKIRSRAIRRRNKLLQQSLSRQSPAINKAREPGADIGGLVKMARDALRATAN